MKIFHIVCMVLMIAMMQHTCLADVQTEIIYGDGWTRIQYSDGRVEIQDGVSNYFRWDGVWRPKSELNILSGDWPYFKEENNTHYFLTRGDDSLVIRKTIGSLSFGLDKITLDFTVTPVQLATRSVGPYEVDGVNWWGIHIPESLVTTTKQFNWDHKKPNVRNNTLINYIDEFGENCTTYGKIDQSNFGYRRINNKLYFIYNQDARNWGASSELIIFEFNSWDIVGSGGSSWSGNVTYDSNITLVQCTGNVELQDYIPDFISKWRFDDNSTLDENTTNSNDGINYGATYNPIGYYGGVYDFDGTDYIESDAQLVSSYPFTVSGWINTTAADGTVFSMVDKDVAYVMYVIGIDSGYARLIARNPDYYYVVSSATYNDGQPHFLKGVFLNDTYKELFVDNVSVGVLTTSVTFSSTIDRWSIGRMGDTTPGAYVIGWVDDVRVYGRGLSSDETNQTRDNHHKATGNISRNYTTILGAGEELQNLKYNGSGSTSVLNVDLYASVGGSAYILIQANASTNTNYDVSGNGYKYARWKLNTADISLTPVIYNISAEYGVAGATPNITSWGNNKTNNNTLSVTVNISENINFNAIANQSIATWNWYKDDVDQSYNYDNITLSWTSTGSKSVIVNATNSNGTSSSIEWSITVVDPGPGPTPTPSSTRSVSSAQYDELDFPLILYIVMISMLYLLIVFRHGVAAVELSLIYLIFAFFFLLFQTITISVNYIYLTLFLLLFLISIAGITKQGAD